MERRNQPPVAGRGVADVMDRCFPGSQWLRLDRDTVAALARYKSARGFLGWDDTLESLLAQAEVTR